MYTNAADYGTPPSPVTMNPIRWWAKCAFGRDPLLRAADRLQAWGLVVAFVAVVAAVVPAVALGHLGYAERTQTIAAEASARHPVQAIALSDSTSDPTQVESTSTATPFVAHVRWTSRDIPRDDFTKVEQPVRAGQPVQIWLDDTGKVTSPPQTDVDARVDAMGTAALVWLGFVAVVGIALAMLVTALRRARNRKWDHGLQALVDDGGGSAAQRP